MPRAVRIGTLGCQSETDDRLGERAWSEAQAAAQRLGLQLVPARFRRPEEIASVLEAVRRQGIDAVFVFDCSLLPSRPEQVTDVINRSGVPAAYPYGRFVRAGGLMSYGVNTEEQVRRSAVFVDKILKGAKPGDLPVEQPTKFELVFNLKTARALRLTIPPSVLARADQVLE